MTTLEIKNEVEKELLIRGFSVTLEITNVLKNNGELTGLTLKNPDSNISPTVYIEGNEVSQMADIFEEFLSNASPDMGVLNILNSKEYILSNLNPLLLSEELNPEMMVKCPSSPSVAEGLRIFYTISLPNNLPKLLNESSSDVSATTKVTYNLMDAVGLTLEELEQNARFGDECFSLFNPFGFYEFGTMDTFLKLEEVDKDQMYVISNNDKIHGASVIEKIDFSQIYNRFGKFYLLPSSIHEWIIKFDDGDNLEMLSQMVKEVNQTCVAPNEVLSNKVFYWSNEGLKVAC